MVLRDQQLSKIFPPISINLRLNFQPCSYFQSAEYEHISLYVEQESGCDDERFMPDLVFFEDRSRSAKKLELTEKLETIIDHGPHRQIR